MPKKKTHTRKNTGSSFSKKSTVKVVGSGREKRAAHKSAAIKSSQVKTTSSSQKSGERKQSKPEAPKDDFDKVAEYVVSKNAELYKRLS
jgi:hypothetical protein